jgi:hypothetical protein
MKGMSQNQFAAVFKTKQPVVSKAVAGGRLVADDRGLIDPDHPTNSLWLSLHRQGLDSAGRRLRGKSGMGGYPPMAVTDTLAHGMYSDAEVERILTELSERGEVQQANTEILESWEADKVDTVKADAWIASFLREGGHGFSTLAAILSLLPDRLKVLQSQIDELATNIDDLEGRLGQVFEVVKSLAGMLMVKPPAGSQSSHALAHGAGAPASPEPVGASEATELPEHGAEQEGQ